MSGRCQGVEKRHVSFVANSIWLIARFLDVGEMCHPVFYLLGYIRQLYKVAFLQGGELIEYDSPDSLLANSAFANLYKVGSY